MSTQAYEMYQRRFEHQRVKLLIKSFGFPEEDRIQRIGKLKEYARNNSSDGEGWLSFDMLDVPEGMRILGVPCRCPVILEAQSFASQTVKVITMPRLFRFGKTLLYDKYVVRWHYHFHTRSDERPFGLIFGLGGISRGVILHNAELPGETGRTTLHYHSRIPDEPPKLTLEPYAEFLQRMVRVWCAKQDVTTTHSNSVQPRLEKWIVTLLGSGPAVIVLAWLWGAWLDPDQRYHSTRNGTVCLEITQSIIAHGTGLSNDSVKDAMERLRREGAILKTRGDRRTYVELVQPEGVEALE